MIPQSHEVSNMNEMIQKIQTAFLLVLLIGSAVMVLVPTETEGQVFPEIDISVTRSASLDVSPSGTGVGMIYVKVKNNAYDCSVRVQVTVDAAGYQVSPRMFSVNLAPNSERTIPVAIVAMLRTSYRTTSANVFAEVTHVDSVPAEGVSETNGGFLVQTQPYGKVILESDKPFQKVKPGSEYPFEVKVVNSGNAVDTFGIEILNKEELVDDGFSISLSATTTRDTDPQSYDMVTVQLQTPRDFGWKNTYYTLDIEATSEVSAKTDAYSITIWVYGFGVSGFEPLYSIVALAIVGSLLVRKRSR